jgi:hypothetical protein
VIHFTTFLLYMLLCVVSLLTVLVLRRRIHPIELVFGYLVVVILIQQSFTIMVINLKMFEMASGWQAFLAIKFPGMFYYPIVYLWLLSYLFTPEIKLWTKPLILGAFITLLVISDIVNVLTGLIIVHHTNISDPIIRHSVLIFIAALFFVWLRRRMRKEGIAI